jgi:hypothetical protein
MGKVAGAQPRIGGVAGFATRAAVQRERVTGIETLGVIVGVATRTGVGRIVRSSPDDTRYRSRLRVRP